VYILGSLDEKTMVMKMFGDFAAKGVLTHVNSDLYQELRSQESVIGAKEYIRPISGHNDKLGFDWSVSENRYIHSLSSRQFKTSGYPKLLETASKWHNGIGNVDYGKHLEAAAKLFSSEIIRNADRYRPITKDVLSNF